MTTTEVMTVLDLPDHVVDWVRHESADYCQACAELESSEGCVTCGGSGIDVSDAPVGGDTAHYGSFSHCTKAQATHARIVPTEYSDYAGSDYDASNYRSLLRDFPNAFVDLYGGYSTRALALPIYGATYTEQEWWGSPAVLEAVSALEDYPLYDESDHSDYVEELFTNAWDEYLSSDAQGDLYRLYGIDDNVVMALPDEWWRTAWYAIHHELLETGDINEYPYGESATSVVIPGEAEVTATLAHRIRERISTPYAITLVKYPSPEEGAPELCYCTGEARPHLPGNGYVCRKDSEAVK